MKRHLVLLTFLLISLGTRAQFKLTGTILNYEKGQDVQINIPDVYGFHKENSINIPVSATGAFAIVLNIKATKFADIILGDYNHKVLLTPGKNLAIKINLKKAVIEITGGSASPENKLLTAIKLNETPYFMRNENAKSLGLFNLAKIKSEITDSYLALKNEKLRLIKEANVSTFFKKLLTAEVEYLYLNTLNTFARAYIKNRATADSLLLAMFDTVKTQPLVSPAGPEYYFFVRNYLSYTEMKVSLEVKAKKINTFEPLPYFGISMDSANVLVKRYGKAYWRWFGSTQLFSENVAELFGYQEILNLCYDKDISPATVIAKAFKTRFPQSKYISTIDQKIDALYQDLSKNKGDKNIKIISDYKNVRSIMDVIKDYKGKVVYLDVWGTWCGPCKDELNYLPQLRSTFKDKDVVFVYLDMDEDEKDKDWKDYIVVNGLTGVHLRKNKKDINLFWKELLANSADKEISYPQYFIFDKQGNITVSKAKRPSDGEALYKDLEAALNK